MSGSGSTDWRKPSPRTASIADDPIVSDLTVSRWARYGHDRLYVRTPDGTRLGYWDNKSARLVLEVAADEQSGRAALTQHGVAQEADVRTAPEPPVVTVAPVAPTPASAVVDDRDLAAVRAGAAAREQALALKQAAPVRTLLARALGVHTEERAWRLGADGEQAVAARLSKLGDRWKILHAVPVGEKGSDIDHVVIGPGGVFTINAKHHPDAAVWVRGDTFMVNGQRLPYVRNSRFEARRTAKLLASAGAGEVPVTGVIAVMGASRGLTIKEQPAAVVVVACREVGKWIARRQEHLTDERVETIYAVARKASTWR